MIFTWRIWGLGRMNVEFKIRNMEQIAQFQRLFLEHLDKKTFKGEPSTLYEPINYLLNIGGKRMRPVLLLMACEMFDTEISKAMDAALAVEVFHNFTLAHDDIMDEADIRRGQPAVHIKYNINSAILSGDLMLIKSYELLAASPGYSSFSLLFQVFNKAAIEICEGQQMDMDFEKRKDVSLDEYLKMVEYKTAVLLGASMQMGALIGGASDSDARQLYNFAVDLGIAFQINDDVLDAYGDPSKVGKKAGGDIAQNKKTFLWISCLEAMTPVDRSTFEQLTLLGKEAEHEKIQGVLSLYSKYQVRQKAEKRSKFYFEKGLAALNDISVPKHKLNPLITFAHNLMVREY